MESLQEMMHFVGSGLFVAIFMLWIVPRFAWKRIAHLPYCSPNWITLWSVPITWIGFVMYFWGNSYHGFLIVVIGLVLDRIDGKMAQLNEPFVRMGMHAVTFQDHWRHFKNELNHPGSTETGKWLDPLTDKLKTPPMILVMAYMGYLSIPLAIGIVLVAVFSTLMRPPFQLIPDRWIAGKAATGFGKYKIIAEFMPMILVVPLHQGWEIQFPLWTLDALLGLALLLGILSVLSRFQYHNRTIKGVVDQVNQPFKHVD